MHYSIYKVNVRRSIRLLEVLWLSCKRFTVCVDVVDGRITETAPIVKKFRGQSIDNLRRWMTKLGGFREEALDGCPSGQRSKF